MDEEEDVRYVHEQWRNGVTRARGNEFVTFYGGGGTQNTGIYARTIEVTNHWNLHPNRAGMNYHGPVVTLDRGDLYA